MTTRQGQDAKGRFLPGNKLGRGNLRAGAPTRLVNFRMTTDEIAGLDAMCQHYGMSRSALVRAIVSHVTRKRPKL